MSGKKIVLAASDSESSEYLRSTWRQMLLATLPARYARIMGTDWSIKNEVAPDGQAKYVPHGAAHCGIWRKQASVQWKFNLGRADLLLPAWAETLRQRHQISAFPVRASAGVVFMPQAVSRFQRRNAAQAPAPGDCRNPRRTTPPGNARDSGPGAPRFVSSAER